MGNVQASGPSASDGSGFTPSDGFFLGEAAKAGNVEVLRLFLRKNPALVYAVTNEENTAWHIASMHGHADVVQLLINTTQKNSLSNTFDPLQKVTNLINAKGQTALMLACRGGHSAVVELLLRNGATFFMADKDGCTALHYAALCGPDTPPPPGSSSSSSGGGGKCMTLILEHMLERANRETPGPKEAAAVIRRLLNAGDVHGRTAMHYAAWSGSAEAAHALWRAGADVLARTISDCYDSDLPCNTGTTPLHLAAMRGHQPVVLLLLAAWLRSNADLNEEPSLEEARSAGPAAGASAGANAAVLVQQLPAEEREGGAAVGAVTTAAAAAVANMGGDGATSEKLTSEAAASGANALAAAGVANGGSSAGAVGQAEAPSPAGPPPGTAADVAATSHGAGAPAPGAATSMVGRTPSRVPADPRLIVDAYGNTPHSIASKRRQDRGQMMIELLDPATDLAAGFDELDSSSGDEDGSSGSGEDDDDDDRHSRGSGSNVPLTGGGRLGIDRHSSRQRCSGGDRGAGDRGGGGGRDEAVGPLLLWEGVEVVQKLACDPAAYARLAETHSMLQPPRPAYAPLKAAAGAGAAAAALQPSSHRPSAVLSIGMDADAVPDCYLCPLTCKLFRDPVVAADGVTYEREAIERHLRLVTTSPTTKQRLPSTALYPNKALLRAIEHWQATQRAQQQRRGSSTSGAAAHGVG